VNGLAASIELYLGIDVLRREDGSLTPVQWRGYDQSIHQYQGELLDKGEIQERFAEKLQICLSSPSRMTEFDWDGVRGDPCLSSHCLCQSVIRRRKAISSSDR